MKPIFEEFCCPQCGGLRYINVNGVCFDCDNKNTLIVLAEQRKSQQNLDTTVNSLSVENYY